MFLMYNDIIMNILTFKHLMENVILVSVIYIENGDSRVNKTNENKKY